MARDLIRGCFLVWWDGSGSREGTRPRKTRLVDLEPGKGHGTDDERRGGDEAHLPALLASPVQISSRAGSYTSLEPARTSMSSVLLTLFLAKTMARVQEANRRRARRTSAQAQFLPRQDLVSVQPIHAALSQPTRVSLGNRAGWTATEILWTVGRVSLVVDELTTWRPDAKLEA